MLKRIAIFVFAFGLDIVLLHYAWQTNQLSFVTKLVTQEVTTTQSLPCTTPIRYRIDQIDPEFQISQDELIENASSAAQIWNSAFGNNLFVFDPEGELRISLIYDGRQKLSSQITVLQTNLESAKQSLDPRETKYQKDVATYEIEATQLKAEIRSWNEMGGTSQNEADRLNERAQSLRDAASRLNAEAQKLNQLGQNFNAQVGSLNDSVTTFNAQLNEKPEEGIFWGDQNRIEVFFNSGKRALVHTLAHEMGHALGMNHVDDQSSILSVSTNSLVKPSKADLKELQRICGAETLLNEQK